jgi:hypothetical protein
MSGVANDTLLELHCAARPFIGSVDGRGRSLKELEARARLRRAIVAVMRERSATVPPGLVSTAEEALESLRAIIARCVELRANWTDVVAIVNRETREEALS